jgi:antitoxin ParD1/3/4
MKISLEERDRMRSLRLEDLRAEIKRGLDSGEATPFDVEAVKARGRKRFSGEDEKTDR